MQLVFWLTSLHILFLGCMSWLSSWSCFYWKESFSTWNCCWGNHFYLMETDKWQNDYVKVMLRITDPASCRKIQQSDPWPSKSAWEGDRCCCCLLMSMKRTLYILLLYICLQNIVWLSLICLWTWLAIRQHWPYNNWLILTYWLISNFANATNTTGK